MKKAISPLELGDNFLRELGSDLGSDFFQKFHPNTFYSIRGFSEYELGFVRSLFDMIKKRYENLTEAFSHAAVVWHSTVGLVNSVFWKEPLSLVHLDAEFMRITEFMSEVFAVLYDARKTSPQYPGAERGQIVDRFIFHAAVANGSYQFLREIPQQDPVPSMTDRSFEWSIYQACFVLAHELAHVEMFREPERVRLALNPENEFFKEELKPPGMKVIEELQPDYAYIIARTLDLEYEKPRSYLMQDIVQFRDRSIAAELDCDLKALTFATRAASEISSWGVGKPWRMFLALLNLQCTQLLWEIAMFVVRTVPWDRGILQPDWGGLHDASVRQLFITVFLVQYVREHTPTNEFENTMCDLLDALYIRNGIVSSFSIELCRRARDLSRRCGPVDHREARDIIEAWGYYRADRLSTVLWRPGKDKSISKPKPAASNKVGRNDPCPCGSGKKYKHCCLGKARSFKSMAQ